MIGTVGKRVLAARTCATSWFPRIPVRLGSAVLRSHSLWLILLALVTYGRIWQIQDVIWDDNAWLLSIYATENLGEFLKIGFHDLRREPLGVFLYLLFGLHRYSEIFYPVWHGLWLLLSALSPVVLYALILHLFKDRILALFSGLAFIAFPLDYTIGFASAANYPVALFLVLVSLLFSAIMVSKTVHQYLFMAGSLLTAMLSQYVFLEASVALEPARFLMFAFLSGGTRWNASTHWRFALRKSIPFLLLMVPLVIYKLGVPTSGIHSALYQLDIHNLFDIRQYAISLAHFFFFPWIVLGLNAGSVRPGTVLAAVIAAIMVMILSRRLSNEYPVNGKKSAMKTGGANPSSSWSVSQVALFALASIIPVFLLFQLAGRPISWGMDSSHAALCQTGYALFVGLLLSRIWGLRSAKPLRRHSGSWAVTIMIGVLAGIGVFFSNLNIDQYHRSWQSQSNFLQEFLHRFPQLPEGAFLVADVRDGDLYSDIDLYDIEFSLNLLYAPSSASTGFYRYKLITAEDFSQFAFAPVEVQRSGNMKIMRATDHGVEVVDIDKLIFIHYRDGRLIVNREIADRYPDISYRSWLDRESPGTGVTYVSFPLRGKFVFAPSADR
jgi:hypothetical protein